MTMIARMFLGMLSRRFKLTSAYISHTFSGVCPMVQELDGVVGTYESVPKPKCRHKYENPGFPVTPAQIVASQPMCICPTRPIDKPRTEHIDRSNIFSVSVWSMFKSMSFRSSSISNKMSQTQDGTEPRPARRCRSLYRKDAGLLTDRFPPDCLN